MATNDFKPFATGAGANVMSQADYLTLSALLTGFQSGKASSAQVNKAIRQGTTIAALVGQFIANANIDALDNGDLDALVTKFTNALTSNLNLKTAAKRDVGTGANQIPDMSSFTSTTGDQGKFVLPGGLIIQYVKMAIPANVSTNTDRNFTWGTAMSNTMACWCSIEGLATLRSANIVFTNNSGAVINYINNSSITTSAWGFCLGKL
jgi:hypothetical protein